MRRVSLKRLRRRAEDAADESAAGSAMPAGTDADPAGTDPDSTSARKRPSARERGAMRRRARQLRRRREAMLLELGALLFEMHRRNRREPELLERKAEEIRLVDAEERGLTEALGSDRRTVEVVAAGIAGGCPSCGALVSTEARFCERCGTPVGRRADARREARAESRAGEAPRQEAAAESRAGEAPRQEAAEPRASEAPSPDDRAETAESRDATAGRTFLRRR